jgi:hypothetical protein
MSTLKHFKVSSRMALSELWGNGHTIETDPFKKGWRCMHYPKGDVYLVGRKGVAGCFSALLIGKVPYSTRAPFWDVALYSEETPQQVHDYLMNGKESEHHDACSGGCIYKSVGTHSGWGLEALELLTKDMAELAEFGGSHV